MSLFTSTIVPSLITTIVDALQNPLDISVNPITGDLYVVECNKNRICKIDGKTREMMTVHDDVVWSNPCCVAACANDEIIVGELSRFTALKKVSETNLFRMNEKQFNKPQGITINPLNGDIYVSDMSHVIRKFNRYGTNCETVAGNGNGKGFGGDNGLAKGCELNNPRSMAFLTNGDFLIVDQGNCRIRKVDSQTRIISTIAGNGNRGNSGDGGLAIDCTLNQPSGIAVDSTGNFVFVSDCGNHNVRMINLKTQRISTIIGKESKSGFSGDYGFAEDAQLSSPQSLAFHDGTLYIADQSNNRIRSVKFLACKTKQFKKYDYDRIFNTNIICCGAILKLMSPKFHDFIFKSNSSKILMENEYHQEMIQNLIDSLIYTQEDKLWYERYDVIDVLFVLGCFNGDDFNDIKN